MTSKQGPHRAFLGPLAAAVIGVMSAPAAAHHVMEGKLPGTMLEGLLSGLGHPVIGPDHLAFIVALGVAAAFMPGGIIAIAAFVALSTAGVLAHAAELNVPMSEQLVALTVLLAGAALAWRHGVARPTWLALAGAAGLLHGYAFGESIIGAEQTALGAYLVGIALVTACITTIVMLVTRRISAPEGAASQRLRLAGVVLGCIGAVLLAGTLVSSPAP